MKRRTNTSMLVMITFVAIMTVILGGIVIYKHTHRNEEIPSILVQRTNDFSFQSNNNMPSNVDLNAIPVAKQIAHIAKKNNPALMPCDPSAASTSVYGKDKVRNKNAVNPSLPVEGVAVAILLHSPRWFTLRYTMMTNNVDNNIPDNWKIQIFYVANGGSQKGIDLNIGLQRLVQKNRLVLTAIPLELSRKKKRRIELLTDLWFWDKVLADKVLIFGGNSVICSNSPRNILDFTVWDYIGTPWNSIKHGVGGDGGISYRNKTAMIEVIEYKLDTVPVGAERENAYKAWPREDIFFVKTMLEINDRLGYSYFKIADREATLQFGAMDKTIQDNTVFAVSGTLAGVNDTQRASFIDYCIELKMIFPVLDNPNCFGAHPNSEACAQSICALKPGRKGGC